MFQNPEPTNPPPKPPPCPPSPPSLESTERAAKLNFEGRDAAMKLKKVVRLAETGLTQITRSKNVADMHTVADMTLKFIRHTMQEGTTDGVQENKEV